MLIICHGRQDSDSIAVALGGVLWQGHVHRKDRYGVTEINDQFHEQKVTFAM